MLAAGNKFLHAHKLDKDFIINQIEYLATCLTDTGLVTILRVFVMVNHDISAACKMTHCVHVAERISDVETGGVSIGVDAPRADDIVVGLKCLRGVERSRAEEADVKQDMQNDMEFRLIEPAGVP